MNILPRPLRRLLREAVLYAGASPQSRWHQLDTLRTLDNHLLRDIGVDRLTATFAQPRNGRDAAFLARDGGGTSPGV